MPCGNQPCVQLRPGSRKLLRPPAQCQQPLPEDVRRLWLEAEYPAERDRLQRPLPPVH